MRRYRWTILLATLALAQDKPAEPQPFDPDHRLGAWRLAWHDEFDGDKLDRDQWFYRTGERYWSVQRPENVSVADGRLKLACRRERAGKLDYTAGGVISKRRFKFGYYEARFKVPAGRGWHTSFWAMPADGAEVPKFEGPRVELDFCENDSQNLKTYGTNIHRHEPKPHQGFGHKVVKTPDLAADFHIWGCEYTAERCTFYFDGQPVQQVDVKALPKGEMNVWLTTIASPLGGTKSVDDTQLPAYAEYDWVRFYERPAA